MTGIDRIRRSLDEGGFSWRFIYYEMLLCGGAFGILLALILAVAP